MKKFAKISLAAAVAVAGLSSVASAKPLEEAIKGVDATGYVTYQYNDKADDVAETNANSNVYKAAITLSVPAADDVAVKVTGVVRGVTTSADANPSTTLAHANFTYTGVQNLTVIAGKQALNTPWTEGSSVINPTQNGTGVLALYNAGFATLAAGHFVNNSINSDTGAAVTVTDNDISVLAAIVPVAEVATLQAWYAQIGSGSQPTNPTYTFVDIDGDGVYEEADGDDYFSRTAGITNDLSSGAKVWSIAADVNLMDVAKLSVRHSTLKGDEGSLVKQKLTKAVLSGAAGPVNLAAGYGKTGSNGGLVAFDKDSDANFIGWDVGLNGVADAKAYLLNANMNVLPSVNVGLTHVSAKVDDASGKWKETYAQVTYNHTKNLSAYVRYGVEKDDIGGEENSDITKGRLQIGYKF